MADPPARLSPRRVLAMVFALAVGVAALYALWQRSASAEILTAASAVVGLLGLSVVAALGVRFTAQGAPDDDKRAGVRADTDEVIRRLTDRHALMDAAIDLKRLDNGAGFALQHRFVTLPGRVDSHPADASVSSPPASDIAAAVRYRLGITDLFVEKAQFHLEQRAGRYEYLGYGMYLLALLSFVGGAALAIWRLYEPPKPIDASQPWIDLLLRFIQAFTAYGLIVASAVALARGARACLDQRERLLAKRHSLRQGRLYLHLTGGRVTIDEMEHAFNWNHAQDNAFTHMPTDAKAPWGAVADEFVKVVPELVKAGVTAAQGAAPQAPSTGPKESGAPGRSSA